MVDLAKRVADITLRKSFNTLPDGKTENPFDYVNQLRTENQRKSTAKESIPSTPKTRK